MALPSESDLTMSYTVEFGEGIPHADKPCDAVARQRRKVVGMSWSHAKLQHTMLESQACDEEDVAA